MSVKISDLPTASSVSDNDYLIIDDGLTTKKARSSQVGCSLLDVYPVGALYLSVVSTDPATLFGGTWEQITTDAYLKIVTSGAGSAGGTSSDHTIPLTSMPSHSHTQTNVTNDNIGAPSSTSYIIGPRTISSSNTGSAGGGQAYYPYYIGVYVWKRTA